MRVPKGYIMNSIERHILRSIARIPSTPIKRPGKASWSKGINTREWNRSISRLLRKGYITVQRIRRGPTTSRNHYILTHKGLTSAYLLDIRNKRRPDTALRYKGANPDWKGQRQNIERI